MVQTVAGKTDGRLMAGDHWLLGFSDRMSEFRLLADLLGMDDDERCSLLAISGDAWNAWTEPTHGTALPLPQGATRRRLDYLLPLMRQMADHCRGADAIARA